MIRTALGQGLFADFDDEHIVITAEDGNTIYVSPLAYSHLVEFHRELKLRRPGEFLIPMDNVRILCPRNRKVR